MNIIKTITVTVIGTSVAALTMMAAFMTGEAYPHDAPAGWSYPLMCCSNQDCKPTLSGEVRETREGYTLTTTGEFVPHGDRRIKFLSQDGEIHICQQGGDFDAGRILCILVPPQSF